MTLKIWKKPEYYYSTGYTIWKGLKMAGLLTGGGVLIDILNAIFASSPEDYNSFITSWDKYVLAIAMSVLTIVINYLKNRDKPRKASVNSTYGGSVGLVIVGVILADLMLGGCSTVSSKLTADDTTYSYETKVTMAPFSKLDQKSASFKAGVDKDGSWEVKAGEQTSGVDNTGQIEVMNQFTTAMTQAMASVFGMLPQIISAQNANSTGDTLKLPSSLVAPSP